MTPATSREVWGSYPPVPGLWHPHIDPAPLPAMGLPFARIRPMLLEQEPLILAMLAPLGRTGLSGDRCDEESALPPIGMQRRQGEALEAR